MPWADVERDVLDHVRLPVRVRERDVVEDEIASRLTFGLDAAFEERFAVLLDDLHQAAVRDQSRRGLHDNASQVADRPDQLDDESRIRHVRADRDRAVDRQIRAVDESRQHLETQHHVRERPEQRVHFQQAFAAQELLEVVLLELAHFVILPRKGFHHAHAGQVFLQGCGQDGFLFLVLLVALGHHLEEPQRHTQHHRDGHHRHPRQRLVQVQERGEVDEEHQQDASHADGLLAEEAPQGIHV